MKEINSYTYLNRIQNMLGIKKTSYSSSVPAFIKANKIKHAILNMTTEYMKSNGLLDRVNGTHVADYFNLPDRIDVTDNHRAEYIKYRYESDLNIMGKDSKTIDHYYKGFIENGIASILK